tara:strand:- start:1374 stop:2237 length:864 start_codon:yes stop_codon:yes gene_type:complete
MLSIHDLGIEPIEAKPVALITPEKAAEMLSTFNQGNRKLSDGLVKQYARAMQNDSWSHVTELSFDTSNRLIDGQHRLSAVIKSNIPQKFSLNLNCPPEAQRDIDTGKLRSTKDTLDMIGAPYAAQLASTIMLYHQWTNNHIRQSNLIHGNQQNGSMSRSEKNDYVAQMYTQHKELCERVNTFSFQVAAKNNGSILNRSAVGAAGLRAWDLGHLNIYENFIDHVAEGMTFQHGTPEYAMSGSLNKLAARHPRERGKLQILALITYFFNRRHRRLTSKKVQFKTVEDIK